jgi:hypothetical protein
MTLTVATLLTAAIFLLLGLALVSRSTTVVSLLKGFPRSTPASVVFFGLGTAAFLYRVGYLSPADFGDYKVYLLVAFSVLAVLAFFCVPDFLAVRGLAVCVLLGAMPLLDAAFMRYEVPQRLFMVTPIYLIALPAAIWLGAQPWRLRDFLEWLFRPGARARTLGGVMVAYGVVLAAVAFTY